MNYQQVLQSIGCLVAVIGIGQAAQAQDLGAIRPRQAPEALLIQASYVRPEARPATLTAISAPVARREAAPRADADTAALHMIRPKARPELAPVSSTPRVAAAPVKTVPLQSAAVRAVEASHGRTRAESRAARETLVVKAHYRWCVPFARDYSDVDLRGNANRWWHEAADVYARGHRPERGAVLNFRGTRQIPMGHVAVVSRVINRREILVNQANWVPRRVTLDVAVIDVSAKNDWSQVRVANGRSFGSVYPTYGFIYGRAPGTEAPARIERAAVVTRVSASQADIHLRR